MKYDPLLAAILAALATSCGDSPERTAGTGCMTVDAMLTECPHSDQVALEDLFLHFNCDEEIVSKSGPGTLTMLTPQSGPAAPACCYAVEKIDPDPTAECVVGRPFKEANVARSAAFQLQGELGAEAWARAAAGEHASVAAFARLSLQLMALGAPLDLLEGAHRAALDEVRHTRACVDMAKRCGGSDVAIAPFPFSQPIAVTASLAEVAVDALREGCINETLGAYAAREAAELAQDPAARKTLQTLAEDEARHAALAYQVVAWALSVGGSDVRTAVLSALAMPREQIDTNNLAKCAGVAPEELSELQAQGMRCIVQPALGALLAA
jgi:hypothetical protein